MNDIAIRTEDLRDEDVLSFFVRTQRDNELVAALKSSQPIVIEGSRGTGKSFLLRVCEQEQLRDFSADRILPVYVSFSKSSLLSSGNNQQCQSWMLARLCSVVLRCLYQQGLLLSRSAATAILSGGDDTAKGRTPLEAIVEKFEDSYKTPGIAIDAHRVPSVESVREAIEDLCRERNIRRLNVLFDEAAHIFRPQQQREFFTLFRDLRCPYVT